MKKQKAKQTGKNRKTSTRKHQMLKFYLWHGMIVDKVREAILFTQSKWLEKHIYSTTQKME